jgi:hypothetical protein
LIERHDGLAGLKPQISVIIRPAQAQRNEVIELIAVPAGARMALRERGPKPGVASLCPMAQVSGVTARGAINAAANGERRR